jgi:hypothetical protein
MKMMKKCALCGEEGLEPYKESREGVETKGWKCAACGETFFPSSEMLRWEVLTGRRKAFVRKVRAIGNSIVVTLPDKLVKEKGIHENDFVLFQSDKKGTLLKIIHPD